jgi:signal transduction histidine kinase
MKGFEVRPTNIYINEIITNIFELFITRTTEKQLLLTSLVSPDTMVYADTNMVQIIIRNLVSNAIKFCNEGDSISVDAKIKGEKIEFCVFDTGIGIEKDVLQKILNQESVTTYGTQREKGTGLGLLLCKEFIEKNGGNFWVESEVGKGSYFFFTLPNASV